MMTVLTFLLYAVDKFAAIQGWSRIPEKLLHLLTLLGGWFGGFLAQVIVNHKSSKRTFKRLYWLTVIFNIVFLLTYLH